MEKRASSIGQGEGKTMWRGEEVSPSDVRTRACSHLTKDGEAVSEP